MAKIELTGLDDYDRKLRQLGADGAKICKAATYEGADEVADTIRAAIEDMQVISDGDALVGWRTETPAAGVTSKQKQGLLNGLYLRKMQEDAGFIFTQVGFAGYNEVKTRKYPSGQPNALIARSIESGSSARTKKPFVRPAVNKAKAAATERMRAKIIEMVDKIMN